jgi:hypothetical protein
MLSSSPGRDIPILNSFLTSPLVPVKSMIATGDTSTHRGDVIWETNGICRAQQTRRRLVEASKREVRGRDEGMHQHKKNDCTAVVGGMGGNQTSIDLSTQIHKGCSGGTVR